MFRDLASNNDPSVDNDGSSSESDHEPPPPVMIYNYNIINNIYLLIG